MTSSGAWPLAQALEEGDWDRARPLLPEGFELVTLVRAVSPKVRQFVEQMRRSMA